MNDSQWNNRFAEVKQQGQSDANKGYVPSPSVAPSDQRAYDAGYGQKKN